MASGVRKIIKATFMVTKKKGLSDEQFLKHYTEVHMPMVAEILKRHGGLHYAVHFTLGAGREIVQEKLKGAMSPIDCDAVVSVEMPDMESLWTMFADPDLVTKLKPDEEKFIEEDRRMVIGEEYVALYRGVLM
ncbi:EthD domain-containing protein, partial [Xylogone sp. PMI_703]